MTVLKLWDGYQKEQEKEKDLKQPGEEQERKSDTPQAEAVGMQFPICGHFEGNFVGILWKIMWTFYRNLCEQFCRQISGDFAHGVMHGVAFILRIFHTL